jgi:hypothetical protein
MINVQDIILDDDGDLLFTNGDFTVGYSDAMHQEHIIEANRGYYKESPLLGVYLFQYLKSAGLQAEIKRQIQINLEDDNYQVNKVNVSNTETMNIEIDAQRIK